MNNNSTQSKRFLQVFALTAILMLSLIALLVYIVDPFFLYRVRDKQYLISPIYNNVGLAKNYDYNTAIIGSSMIQNYDLSILRADSLREVKPVKLASGALSIEDTKLLYSLLNKENTNTFIFSLDMIQFNEWDAVARYPAYLQRKTFRDKLRYHFAYESVVRYSIVDIMLQPYLASTDEKDIPPKLKNRYSIDDVGNFSLEATYNNIYAIKEMYKNGKTVNQPFTYNMQTRMQEIMDGFIQSLELEKYKDKEFIFVLPPYSALYWCITQRDNYYQHLTDNIKYLCTKTEEYKNVRIQYFLNLEQITDLNRYSDVTHFDPVTSDYMLHNLRNSNYTLTIENMDNRINTLDSIVYRFKEQNKDWL